MTFQRNRRLARRVVVTALGSALAVSGLAGCGESASSARTATPAPSSAPAQDLAVRDPWVKAGAAGVMTAAFGTLVNNTGADVTITGVTSPASPMELHEMAMKDGEMVMRPKAGGLTLKAGGTHELAPGGDHLMLMKPAAAIKPGDEVQFTLELAGGGTVAFTAVAKPFAGAQESYAPGASGMPMGSGGS
jgi:copper(I)-binding protein